MTKAGCNSSGLTRTPGTNRHSHTTSPIKSLVCRWVRGSKRLGRWAKPAPRQLRRRRSSRESARGNRAPMATRVAWPPQSAWSPNQIEPVKMRRMTGTVGDAVSEGRRDDAGEAALTVGAAHAPGEAAGYREAYMVVLPHPSAGDGEQAGDDAAADLEMQLSGLGPLGGRLARTTAPMACRGLRPKARSVLPVDHAERHDPATVQYPSSVAYERCASGDGSHDVPR